MSLTPLPTTVAMTPPTAPTGEAVACGPGAGDPAAAGFAALVAGLLGQAPPSQVADQVAVTDDAVTDDIEEAGAAEDGEETAVDPGLTNPAAAAPVTGAVPALPARPTLPWRPAGLDRPVDPDLAAVKATPGSGQSAIPAVPAIPGVPATPPPAAAPAALDAPSRTDQPGRPEETPSPAAGVVVVTAAPTDTQTVASAVTSAAAPAGAERARAAALVDQLAPTMARLVSRGEGVHRLTMRLQPEALGEVRVTFTVRHGEVRVHLAGSADTQRLLAEGAPELRRVLEMTGVTDARVVVRDHPAPTPLPQNPTGLLSGQDPTSQQGQGQRPSGDAFGPGTGSGGDHGQQARTRAGTTAREGLTDGAATPRHDPDRRDPLRGLDLTM